MDILLVSLHTSPYAPLGTGDGGGMNVVVAQQAYALAGLGHRVTIATRRDDDGPGREQIAPGIELVRLPAGPPTPLPKSRIDDHLVEFADHLSRLAPAEVVHSHHWMSGVAVLDVARAWGVPHVTSFHSVAAPVGAPLDAGEPPESPRRIPGEQRCVAESDALVTISAAEGRTLIERYGADPARIQVVPPGVDHALFHPAAAPDPDRYLLFAARLQPLKGVDLVLSALAELAARGVALPRLVIAGEVSADFADHHREVEAMVAELGLSDHVSYAGSLPRPEFAELMRRAYAVVVPSRSETFGLVALEAAASGVPVLASATGGLLEAVAEGRSGLLRVRDPREWADALATLLTDEVGYAALRAGAVEHAAGFTWEAAARRLETIYRDLPRRGQ